MLEIANEAAGALSGKGKRVAPKIPLEGDDGETSHADPDHGEGRLSSGQAGIEEAQAWYHDDDHG